MLLSNKFFFLKENIDSVKIELSSDLLKEIDEIHNENPFPCP